MQGCRRRSVPRRVVAVAAAAIALAASSASAVAADKPINIAVQVGYHNTLKPGEWMPVRVDITNAGPDFEGTLEVETSSNSGGPPIGPVVYEAPVSLASGATKHFRTYVIQDFPGPIDVRVVQRGRVVASQEVTNPSTSSGLLVGVLSDRAFMLDGLGSVRPGGSAPQVEHLPAADLPDSAPILRAFDVLAIDDFASDTLTAAQKTALVDYVTQGGSILLGTGGSWRKTLAGLPTGLVPMTVSGSTVPAAIAAFGGAPEVEVVTGATIPGAKPWLSEGGLPLLIEAPVGQGMVMFATFDWGQATVTRSSDFSSVLRQALVRLTYGSISNPTATGPQGKFGGTGTRVSLGTKGGALAQVLGAIPALDLPAWWLIGGLVFLYVLLVGPINYFVLRAIGRRALAWITVPTIALVASAGAYGTSVVTKGTSVLVNEVSVIHVEQGSSRASQEEFTGIITPTRGDYQVGIGSPGALVSSFDYFTGNFSDASLAAMHVNTINSDVTLPGMTAFTLRGFADEGILANGPDVSGRSQLIGGQVTGSIKNSSSLEFTDGVIIFGDSYQKVGAIPPGGSASFSFTPSAASLNGPPVTMTIYPNNLQFAGVPPNNPSDVERENETRSAVIATLTPSVFAGAPINSQTLVVLWTRQPFQTVTVNGAHPRTFVESAVVLSLPVEQIGRGAVPNGVVLGRMVDLNADTMSGAGPPGTVIAQSGSITYAFQPQLAPDAHLTSVSITSNNPYGKVGPIGGGSTSTAKGQAWDWSKSAWVDISYSDSSATAVPDWAVNPSTGEVVLKLSSDGQFMTGWLSLTGTVS